MKTKTFTYIGLAIVAMVALALWQTHTNTLEYKFRNCTEISDNSGYIGFKCKNGWSYYLPTSERHEVFNDLDPTDQVGGATNLGN